MPIKIGSSTSNKDDDAEAGKEITEKYKNHPSTSIIRNLS